MRQPSATARTSALALFRAAALLVLAVSVAFGAVLVGPRPSLAEEALAAPLTTTNVTLSPGSTYDVTTAGKGTDVYIKTGGTYTLRGQSSNVCVIVEPSENALISIYLEDDLSITPSLSGRKNGSGARSAITIREANYSEVEIITTPSANVTLTGLTGAAISKNGTATKLVFKTENPSYPGTINATGAQSFLFSAPGIGSDGGGGTVTGNIHFLSGNIIARGSYAPGIGSGSNSGLKDLTIEGGTVEAYGGGTSAGIGSGAGGSASGIGITNADVKAQGGSISWQGGAGIGCGLGGSVSGIDIKGGTITATGGNGGAGIGGGLNSTTSTISISSGANVTAQGGSYAAGIGSGGGNSKVYEIDIFDGNITATGGTGGAGIGGGEFVEGGESTICQGIHIRGGTITATGGSNASGIGASGFWRTVTDIQISGGFITATGSTGFPGVGQNKATNVKISGGTINATVESDFYSPIVITGGSIKQFVGYYVLVNASGQTVYRTVATIDGLTRQTLIKELDIGSTSSERYKYGSTDLYTLNEGSAQNLYLYLPANTYANSAVDDQDLYYRGNIYPGNTGVLKRATNVTLDSGSSGADGSANARNGDSRISIVSEPTDPYGRTVAYYADSHNRAVASPDGTLYDGTTDYSKDGVWNFDSEATLRTVWEEACYYVKFDANAPAGTSSPIRGEMPNQLINMNDSNVHINSCVYLLYGYEFAGWNTKPDGTGSMYDGGAKVDTPLAKKGETVTLYAQWKPYTYTVTFKSGEGAYGYMEPVYMTFDQPAALPTCTFTSSKKFLGWTATYASGQTRFYGNRDTVTNLCDPADPFGIVPEGITLTATWSWKNDVYVVVTLDDVYFGEANVALVDDAGNKIAELSPLDGDTSTGIYTASDVTPGTYGVTVSYDDKEYPTGDVSVTVEAGGPASALLDYYTIAVEGDKHVSVRLNGRTAAGDVVLKGTQVKLEAEVNGGYAFSGYTVNGVVPEGLDLSDPSEQSVTIRGKATISATARAKNYAVAFDANVPANASTAGSLTGSMDPMTGLAVDTPYVLTTNGYSLPGYTFAGWNTQADGSGTAYGDGATVKNLTNEDGTTIPLYAQWRPISYTVTFNKDAEDATGSMAGQTFDFDERKKLSSNTYSRDGYTFTGWRLLEPDGAFYADGQVVSNLSDIDGAVITLYAQWERDTFTVTFDMNAEDAIGVMDDEALPTIEVWTVPGCGFTRTGFVFAGWNAEANGTGTPYSVGDTIDALSKGDALTLYAQWRPIQYRVAFDANKPANASTEPTGSMDKQSMAYGAGTTLTANGFSLPGYTFAGWNSKADGSGTAYDNEAEVKNLTTEDGTTITLYAQWKPRTYEVTFVGGDGATGATGPQTLTFDDPAALNPCGFAKEGYAFLGWADEGTTGTSHLYSDGETVVNLLTGGDELEGTTLRAIWTLEPGAYVTITKDNEPVSLQNPETEIKLVPHDGQASDPVTGFSATGTAGTYFLNNAPAGMYRVTVEGFSDAGATVEVEDGKTATAFLDYSTITAQGGEHVSVSIEGGASSPSCLTVPTGSQARISATEHTGYVFTKYTASGVVPLDLNATEAKQTVTVSGTVTVTASTRPAEYTIVFEPNVPETASTRDRVSGSTSPMLMDYGTESNLSKNGFTLPGYEFTGWTTNPDGSGTIYNNEHIVSNLATEDGATVRLYAQWEPISCTVEFDKNDEDATGTMVDQVITFDDTDTISRNSFVKGGYVFSGWNTKDDGSGISFQDGVSANLLIERVGSDGETVELYAQWRAITYTVAFDANKPANASTELSGYMADQRMTYGEEKKLTANSFSLPGYTFKGWSTVKDGAGGTPYQDGATVENLTDVDGATVTLYAQWEPVEYAVAFDANVPANASTKLSGTMTGMSLDFDWEVSLTPNAFTLPGYTFAGWNTKADGSGTSYGDGVTVKNLTISDGATVTLYAQWEPRTYTVTFDGNGATGTMDKQTLTFDTPQALHLNQFVNGDKVFLGWMDESTTGTSRLYSDGETVVNLLTGDDVLKGTTLKAIWAEDNAVYVTVTIDNAPVSDAEVALVKEDNPSERIKLTNIDGLPGVYCTSEVAVSGTYGVDVDGYSTAGITVDVASGKASSVFLDYSTITVISDSNALSVLLNGPGAGGEQRSLVVPTGSTVRLETVAKPDAGHVFAGYAVSGVAPAGLNPSNPDEQVIAVEGTVTITAQERAIEYRVSFDANVPASASTRASGAMEPIALAYDVKQNLPAIAFSLPGYTFKGWSTNPKGSGTDYADKAEVENLTNVDGATVTLYAQWKPQTYTVTFDGNGATGTMGPQELTFDTPQALNQNQFENGNKTFIGWSTGALGHYYADRATVTNLCTLDADGVPKGLTLTATWADTSGAVIIVTDDGTLSSRLKASDIKLEQGGTSFGSPTEPSTGVFVFNGSVGGGLPAGPFGILVNDEPTGRTVDKGGIATLDYCTVEMQAEDHANAWIESGGERIPSALVLTDSQLTINASVDEGYQFESYTAIGVQPTWGDGGATQASQTITINGQVLIEAHPATTTYSVVFDGNGGTGAMDNQDMVYDEPQALRANSFTRAGYTFAGWNTAPDGTGTSYDDGETVSKLTANGGEVKLYAQWEPIAPPASTYETTVAVHAHGTASASPTWASAGQTVTVALSPDEGFELRSMTAVDAQGNTVELVPNDNGTYTFTMPAADVSVAIVLGCDGGDLCPARRFPDADPSQWYHDALDWAIVHGVLNGYADSGLMGPDASVSRAQMAQVFWNLAGRPEVAYSDVFDDVAETDWFAGAVSWACSEGLFEGYVGSTLFGPDDTLTREQAAAVMMRWEQLSGYDTSPRADLSTYPDVDEVSDWARDYLSWAVAASIVKGAELPDGQTLLDPLGVISRSQVATLMMRLLAVDPLDPFA